MEKNSIIELIKKNNLIEIEPTIENLDKILWSNSDYKKDEKDYVIKNILKDLQKESCYNYINDPDTEFDNDIDYALLKEDNEAYLVELEFDDSILMDSLVYKLI